MNASKVLNDLIAIENQIIKKKSGGIKTKYKIITLFRDIRSLIEYRIPKAPIKVSEDGHEFTCPRCGTNFQTETDEDTVKDFEVCYVCGQLFKEVD